jgi:hypothetical protein
MTYCNEHLQRERERKKKRRKRRRRREGRGGKVEGRKLQFYSIDLHA